MKKIFSLLCFCLLTSGLYAQTLVPEVENISVSPDNFYTGIRRSVSSDVQKSTGKIVTVYTDKDASAATGDVWCVIYNADMSIAVNAFRINASTLNNQYYPKVKVNQANNYFIVTWTSNQGTDYDAYFKKVDFTVTDATSATVTSSSDVVINSGTIVTGNQYLPMVAFNYQYNEIVFVFRDDSGKDNGVSGSLGVYGQMFSGSTFLPQGSNFLINTTTTNNQIPEDLEISPLNGDLLVTYSSNHNLSNDYEVILRRATYSSATSTYTFSAEVAVNNYLPGPQQWSCITYNSTGGYVLTWSSQQDGSGYGVYAKIFSANHTLIKDEFLVNSTTSDNELISKAFWEESTQKLLFFYHYSYTGFSTLKYRIFDYSGTNLYTPLALDQDALLNSQNTDSYYSMPYDPTYNPYNNRIYLTYDVFNNFTGDSKSKARVLIYKNPNLVTPSFVNSTDLNINWIHSRAYAEDGTLKGETRQYYDSLGHPTQSQARNVVANKILSAATLYDIYNKPILSTLPAPIPDVNFKKRPDFVYASYTSSGQYSYLDFDNYAGITDSATNAGKINNPYPVNSTSLLGKYYSSSNTDEQYVPNTGFPFSMTDYNLTISSGVQRTSAPGDAHRMGGGHESKVAELPVFNELDHYLALKKNYFFGNTGTNNYSTLSLNAKKTISIDQNGLESIVFNDMNGKVLATAKAAGTSSESQTVTLSPVMYYFNLPDGCRTCGPPGPADNIKISEAEDLIEIYDIVTNTLLYSGYANDLNAIIHKTSVGIYGQIRSKSPFKVTYDISYPTPVTYGKLNALSNIGTSVLDFYVKDPTSVSLSASNANSGSTTQLSIKVLNLQNGVVIYTGSVSSFSNTLLKANYFYRIQLENIPFNTDYSSASIKLQVNYSFPYSDWSYYFYDLRGNLQATVAPNGVNRAVTNTLPLFKTTYTYNTLGALLSVNDPNKGLAEYVYRKDGTLRFSQNAKQKVTNKFSYSNYDRFCRPLESGEYDPSRVASNPKVFINHLNQETQTANPNSVHTVLEIVTAGGGLESAARTQVNYMAYDVAASDVTRTSAYLKTKVSYSYKKDYDTDASYATKTWYSYDERGRMVWMDQTLTGLGTKTTDYTYTRELLTNVIYQSGTVAEKFQHKYTYDKAQRLIKAESAAGNGLFQTEGQYYYYLHGPLKRTELGGNVQGVDYVYTIHGALKAINHPELSSVKDPGHDGASGSTFSTDIFGMSIDYFDNDYSTAGYYSYLSNNLNGSSMNTATANYNGLIRAITWQTQGQSISGNPAAYVYTYDYKGQMSSAFFGSKNTSTSSFIAAGNKYSCQAAYDLNGNITQLYTDKGATSDGYVNYYCPIVSGQPPVPLYDKLMVASNSGDAYDSRSYTYDEIGQMIQEQKNSSAKNVTYDVYGKVTEMKKDTAHAVKFYYNERGQRIRKVTYNTSTHLYSFTTWYILDAAGNVMSIYDDKTTTNTFAQTEIPIYGSGRIGVVQKNNITLVYTYELKDHLNNVRATIDRSGTFDGWTDYLPFGEVNPERHFSTFARRRECQGEYAEYDGETEWNSFDLRMYDARMGRWLTPDPKDQHWSPYLSMGNNPVSMTDRDGGEDYDISPQGGGNGDGPRYSIGNQAYNGPQNYIFGGTGPGGAFNGNGNNGNDIPLGIVSQVKANRENAGKSFSNNTSPLGISQMLKNVNDYLGFIGVADGLRGLTQRGMLDYRNSMSINSKIGSFSRFSGAYRSFSIAGKVLGRTGNAGAGISLYIDYSALQKGEINIGRFAYRSTGTAGSIIGGVLIGGKAGGPIGAVGGFLIGGSFWAGEQIYDGYNFLMREATQGINDFENGIGNGWTPR